MATRLPVLETVIDHPDRHVPELAVSRIHLSAQGVAGSHSAPGCHQAEACLAARLSRQREMLLLLWQELANVARLAPARVFDLVEAQGPGSAP